MDSTRRAAISWISFPQWGQIGAVGKSSRIRILAFVTPKSGAAQVEYPLQLEGVVGTVGGEQDGQVLALRSRIGAFHPASLDGFLPTVKS